jgi:hypothetical protein
VANQFPYLTILDAKYKPLELIEEQATADAAPPRWYNETLCKVNDSVVRLGGCMAITTGTAIRRKTSSST